MQYLVALLLATVAAVTSSPYGWAGYPYSGYGYPYYPGGLAAPVVLPSGYLADTPEVASAKAVHSARLVTAGAAAAAAPDGPGPLVTPQGYLADTPEVAAAKARHFAALAGASSGAYHAPYAAGHSGQYVHGYEGQYYPDQNGY